MTTTSAAAIIQQALDGLLTEDEATERLDALQVRGAFADKGYTGFDYANQSWIVAAEWKVQPSA